MLNQSDAYENYVFIHSIYDISQNNDYTDNFQLNKIINNNLSTNINKNINESINIKNHSFDEGNFESKSNNISFSYLKSFNVVKSNENNDLKKIKEENLQNHKKLKFIVRNYEKGKKIFSIKKKIKLGRIRKNSNKLGKHNKYYKDNIIRRFKVLLMNNIYDFINSSFNKNNKSKKQIK